MPHPLTPKKSLGQNFLTDPNTARKIVAALRAPAEAHVVEIGPGAGALTGLLRERFARLTAVEVDARAVALLREALPGLDVRHADVLAVDWAALAAEKGGPLYVIGNLPYYLTSEILFGLLDARAALAEAVVMMQLEVAERLTAAPSTKAYGILSVNTQLFAAPELLFRVSPNVFFPRPEVTSAVVRLGFGGPAPALGRAVVGPVVRAAFGQRRKTLRNSLAARLTGGLRLPERWERKRAEELTPSEFVELARFLHTPEPQRPAPPPP